MVPCPALLICLPEAFHSEVYHTAYLRVKGAEEEVAYTDAYDAKIEEVQERVEAIQDVRCELRYAEVEGEAQQKIDDAEKEVEDGKQEVADAEQELADGRAEAGIGTRRGRVRADKW